MFVRNVLVAALFIFCSSVGFAQSKSGVGFNVGLGVPFLSQAGLNYKISERFGLSAGYGLFDIKVGDAGVKLSMPEVLFQYHPFSGSYFIGVGVGQESFEVKSTTLTNETVSIKIDATTTVVKTGWMWGIGNNGFWFGMDVSYIMPSSPKQTITAPGVPTTDQAYIDAEKAAKQFGETAYTNITFARMGWIF